jgi:hypothetical protein
MSMNKMQAFVESAYEARKTVLAIETLKQVAEKQAQAEREALQLEKFRAFVEQIVPVELLDAVVWPRGGDLFSNGRLPLEVEGCVPVVLIYYCGAQLSYYKNASSAWLLPALDIREPYLDPDEGPCEGHTSWSWNHRSGNYDWCYADDCTEAIGVARERWLKLAEAEAENKRLFDELKMREHEKTMATMRELYNQGAVKAEYVPVVEDKTPCEIFNQALREYVFNLVDARLGEGRE